MKIIEIREGHVSLQEYLNGICQNARMNARITNGSHTAL